MSKTRPNPGFWSVDDIVTVALYCTIYMESLKRYRDVVAGAGMTRNVIGNLKRLNYVRDGSHMHACIICKNCKLI